MKQPLFLPSLYVSGFRGIRRLEFPELGRVTLLVGCNGVGKTAVLDACKVYAARGERGTLEEILLINDDVTTQMDSDGELIKVPDYSALFYTQNGTQVTGQLEIGTNSKNPEMCIRTIDVPIEADLERYALMINHELRLLQIYFGFAKQIYRPKYLDDQKNRVFHFPRKNDVNDSVRANLRSRKPTFISQQTIGPRELGQDQMARLWDSVVVAQKEDLVLHGLSVVIGQDIERLTFLGGHSEYQQDFNRRPLVKLSSSQNPVPLKRLGNGADRLLAIVLALANCSDGILLVDGIENGIHHSNHEKLWEIVLTTASTANVQIIATTHSWDCITGFAEVINETNSDGILYRIEKNKQEEHWVVRYDKQNLAVAADQRIEVR